MPRSNYSIDNKQMIIDFLCYKGAIILKPGKALHCHFQYTLTYPNLTHMLFPFCSAGCGLVQWLINWFVCLSVAGSYVAHVDLEFTW